MMFNKFGPKDRERLLSTRQSFEPKTPTYSKTDNRAITAEGKRRIARRIAAGEDYKDAYLATMRELFPDEFKGR